MLTTNTSKVHSRSNLKTTRVLKEATMKSWVLKDRSTSESQTDKIASHPFPSVYYALRPIIVVATYSGMMPLRHPTSLKVSKLAFRWLAPQTIFSLLLVVSLIITSWMTIYYYAVTPAEEWNIESVAVRPRETVFYVSATAFLLFSINTSRKLPKLLTDWDEATAALTKYITLTADGAPSVHLHLKLSSALLLTAFFITSGIAEHALHDVNIEVRLCENSTSDFFECYFIKGNEYFSHVLPYNRPLSITIFILNKFATLAWNFQDLLIALLARALCANFTVITHHLKKTYKEFKSSQEWKTLREDHIALCDVVRQVDDVISPTVLLSYAINIYFLCIQIFYAIRPSKRSLVETIYFCSSFYHLFVRLCVVSFSAASFYDQAMEPLQYLQRCPTPSYNEEVSRFISHLLSSPPVFTGYKFFPVNRSFFLAMMSVVLTYELILLNVK